MWLWWYFDEKNKKVYDDIYGMVSILSSYYDDIYSQDNADTDETNDNDNNYQLVDLASNLPDASQISYTDGWTMLGASTVQDAIEKLYNYVRWVEVNKK